MFNKNVLCAIGVMAMMSSAALADSAPANLTPSASITNACLVTGNPLSFGAYDPLGGAQVEQTATISVQCTDLMTAPKVVMDQGQNDTSGSLDAPARRLTATVSSTAYYLNYNLYSNSGYSTVWEGVTGVTSPTPDGTAHTMTVYGKIAAAQNQPAGTYSDTVIVTVLY